MLIFSNTLISYACIRSRHVYVFEYLVIHSVRSLTDQCIKYLWLCNYASGWNVYISKIWSAMCIISIMSYIRGIIAYFSYARHNSLINSTPSFTSTFSLFYTYIHIRSLLSLYLSHCFTFLSVFDFSLYHLYHFLHHTSAGVCPLS